jgi:hypothetical protein
MRPLGRARGAHLVKQLTDCNREFESSKVFAGFDASRAGGTPGHVPPHQMSAALFVRRGGKGLPL